MRNPKTGKTAARIRVWYSTEGESPGKPYQVKRLWQDRWVAVPDHCVGTPPPAMEISTEHGDTPDPLP